MCVLIGQMLLIILLTNNIGNANCSTYGDWFLLAIMRGSIALAITLVCAVMIDRDIFCEFVRRVRKTKEES